MSRTSSGGEAGFTLVELMVVMAILGILATFALPAYNDHVTKARRRDAQGALMGLANAMERYFTVNSSYSGATLAGGSAIYPSQAPIDGSDKYYDLSIDVDGATQYCYDVTETTSTAYCLMATPISSSGQNGDGLLTLSSTGARGWDKNADGDTADSGENCWEDSC